jgi:lysophospholipase L1-like esterase
MINTINTWATTNAKKVDIIIQTMNNEPLSGLRPNLAAYEQGYRDIAAANNLLLIDHYPTWAKLYETDPATWFTYVPDKVHPGALGTDRIILPEIQAALTQTPEPSTKALALIAGMITTAYGWHRRKRSFAYGK